MNRILLWEETSTSSTNQDILEKRDDGSFLTHKSRSERRRTSLFAPLHYERNYSYPLVIWLHGPDDDQGQLKSVMPLISMRNYVAAGPCGTIAREHWASVGEDENAVPARTFTWGDSETDILDASQRVHEAVELASSRFNVDRKRVFLAGYDAGGTMALRIALLNPSLFAGVATLGGAFPVGNTPLLNVKQARTLPMFVAHCRDSQTYDVSRMCKDLRLMHSAGLSVTLREYPCDQELTTKMLSDVDSWMMEMVTGSGMDSPAFSDDRN